ncbi:MAG: PIN domain-containing protein [Pyrinomonadaceae bacterium]|nr:PIN domain-containing protein [Pyrinomonadaceae bacterium]
MSSSSASDAPVRIFVDSNVLIEGLFAPWSASRAILVLARSGVIRLVLSPYVEEEVERALLKRFGEDAYFAEDEQSFRTA